MKCWAESLFNLSPSGVRFEVMETILPIWLDTLPVKTFNHRYQCICIKVKHSVKIVDFHHKSEQGNIPQPTHTSSNLSIQTYRFQ